jgi:hypothetical protein
MNRYLVTFWNGATQSITANDIMDCANVVGYNKETEVTHGIHIWVVTPNEYLEVTNGDGEIVARIEIQFPIVEITHEELADSGAQWDRGEFF